MSATMSGASTTTATPGLRRPGGQWLGADLCDETAWRLTFPDDVVAELEGALARDADEPQLPACTAWLQKVRRRVLEGEGIAVAGALPLQRWGPDAAARGVALLARALGPPMAQTHDGVRFYQVTDRGLAPAPGVRRSLTNVEQALHTDGPWLARPARIVSLHCLRAARHGGVSRCISLRRLVADIACEAPDLAARLEQDFLWHRQGEHGPGDSPVSRWPMVWRAADGTWAMRCYTDYVRSGYRTAGVVLDELGDRALARVDELAAERDRWLEFTLAQGEVLWVDNRRCAHARSAFEAASTTGSPRRLVRVWHRLEGDDTAMDG
jgi:alpha-ketoglutarate-dependent taurine dioxygenase